MCSVWVLEESPPTRRKMVVLVYLDYLYLVCGFCSYIVMVHFMLLLLTYLLEVYIVYVHIQITNIFYVLIIIINESKVGIVP